MATEQAKIEEQKQETARNALAPRPGDDALEMGFGSGASFNLLQRAAKMFADSDLLPEIYQDNMANCVILLNMAVRLKADPLMVAQNLYLVHKRPGWSAKFLIATFNQNGAFSKLRYEWTGTKGTDGWGCRAWALEKSTNTRLDGPWITWKLANDEGWVNKTGSKWKTMPEKMFMYRAGAWFVDLYAPEISMGLPTREEMEDIDSLTLIETAPGVYGEPAHEPEAPEPGKINGDKAQDLTQQLRERRGATSDKPKPEPETKATEPATEATSTPAPQREPGDEEDEDSKIEGLKKELESKFAEVARKHSEKFAKERLEMSTGFRTVARVKEEKLGAGIDAMVVALDLPAQK